MRQTDLINSTCIPNVRLAPKFMYLLICSFHTYYAHKYSQVENGVINNFRCTLSIDEKTPLVILNPTYLGTRILNQRPRTEFERGWSLAHRWEEEGEEVHSYTITFKLFLHLGHDYKNPVCAELRKEKKN